MRPRLFPVVVGLALSCFVSAHGQGYAVRAWGDNCAGQTNVPPHLTNVVAVAGGAEHSLAVTTDGTVTGWGGNSWGQVSPPPEATNVTAVEAGYFHSLALRGDGSVVGWGRNMEGQTAVPAEATNVVAISAGAHSSYALRADGRIVAWGQNLYGQTNAPASQNFSSVSGGYHGLGLRMDQTVEGWGNGLWNQTNGSAAGSNVAAVAGGVLHSLALKENGSVVAWGRNLEGQCNVPGNLTNAVAISGGLEHGLALTAEGGVVAWGRNLNGETDVPPDLRNVVVIAAGVSHNLALTTDIPRDPLPPPEVQMIPRLSLMSPTNGEFELQYSETLGASRTWSPLEQVLFTNSSSYHNDAAAIVEAARFYRLSSATDSSVLNLQILPRLTLRADEEEVYRLEYRNATTPSGSWLLLDLVTITNNPQFYDDVSGAGQPRRTYRLEYAD